MQEDKNSLQQYQEVEPDKRIDFLMQQLIDYNPKIPPILVQKILEEVGLESQDLNTFKIIGLFADR